MSTHRRAATLRPWAPLTAATSTLAVLALPKCPACVAGFLYALGLGAGVTGGVALFLRPTLITLAVVAGGLGLLHYALRRAGSRRDCRAPSQPASAASTR